MSSAQATLFLAVAQAVSFLTQPLTGVYPPAVVQQLEKALDVQLKAAFAPTWAPHDPSRGSHHRSLTLTYGGQPPRPLYDACAAAGIRWSEWMRCLGGEFILTVDPGRVGCKKSDGRQITIWRDGGSNSPSSSKGHTHKTMAQRLLEDESDDEIFALINREVHGSGPRPDSRMSSTSSSCSSGSSSQQNSPSTMSRRERARMAKVFIDTSKTDVTQFDGGKTKILTGAVMLGRPSS